MNLDFSTVVVLALAYHKPFFLSTLELLQLHLKTTCLFKGEEDLLFGIKESVITVSVYPVQFSEKMAMV